ncbi:MATE family efflux transporter [uncultured Clostridium sp.]|uniref:MATE family efflux transporter n=1 Tax=uncultured Clostridium sp. TaxID=59620 RepID=UPI00260FA5BF|nr:MATE family efflux transporter [uncultured Clostridium sp.]
MINKSMLKEDIKKLVIKYMLPSVLGMLGLSCCIFLDTMFIGRGIGDLGLAALNIAIPFFNIFTAISLLTGVGGATLLAIKMGKQEYEVIDEIFTVAIIATVIIGIIFGGSCLIFINEIIKALGATGIIFIYVKEYLQIILFGAVLFILSTTLNVFVRNDGNPKISMWAIIGANIVNIILDYILIFPLNMGMRGAAIATTTAQVCGIIILCFHFILKKNKMKFSLKKLKGRYVKRILNNGFPSFVLEVSAAIVIVVFNIKLKAIGGDISISAYSIIVNFSLIIIAVFNGIAQGVQPIVSMNYGAKKYSRVLEAYRSGIKWTIFLGAIFFILGEICPNLIIDIFSKDPSRLKEIGATGIRIYFIALIPMGINIFNVGMLQSMEKARISTIISLIRGLVLVILLLEILAALFGLNGIWMTTPIVEGITLIISCLCIFKEKKYIEMV